VGDFPEPIFGHAEALGASKHFLVTGAFDGTIFDSSHRLHSKNFANTTTSTFGQEFDGLHAAQLSFALVAADMAHVLGAADEFAGRGDFNALEE
jgi:hypothetical protein